MTQFIVIRAVSSPAIGMPLPVVSMRLVNCLIFSALATFPVLLIESLLSLRLGPSALRIPLQYFVDQIIVKFGDFAAVGALYSYFAATIVVGRKRVRPDHTEMAFAIGTHKRIVAWHRNSCIVDLCR